MDGWLFAHEVEPLVVHPVSREWKAPNLASRDQQAWRGKLCGRQREAAAMYQPLPG